MTGFYVYLSLIANLFWLIWFDFFCRWHIAKRRAPGEDFKLGSLLLSAPGQDRIQPILNKHSSKFTQTSAWQYFKLIMRNFHSPTSSPFSLNWNISYLPLALCVSVRLSCQRALALRSPFNQLWYMLTSLSLVFWVVPSHRAVTLASTPARRNKIRSTLKFPRLDHWLIYYIFD